MRIKSIIIRNLRCIEETIVEFDGYTCLVGPNGAGKSTVLCALNIFFREAEHVTTDLAMLTSQDFYQGNTNRPVQITITFADLSQEAREDFKDYVREDVLIVSAEATFDKTTGKAEVRQYGQRRAMQAFSEFFKQYSDGAKVADLISIYTGLKTHFPGLPAVKVKDAMFQALRDYEMQRPQECVLIPSEDQFTV